MELTNMIARRKSVRAYKPEQIPEEALNRILAAGCAAPVGMRKYDTLHLTVVQSKELLERITKTAQQGMKMDRDPLYAAPTLVILSSTEPMAPGIDYANASCIAENMLLAATNENIGSVYLWSPGMVVESDPELKKALQIPEGYKALFGVALGYAAAEDESEKELKLTIGVNRV